MNIKIKRQCLNINDEIIKTDILLNENINKLSDEMTEQEQKEFFKIYKKEQEILKSESLYLYNLKDDIVKTKILIYYDDKLNFRKQFIKKENNQEKNYYKCIYLNKKQDKTQVFICKSINENFAKLYFKSKEKRPFYINEIIEITKQEFLKIEQEKFNKIDTK